MLQGVFKIPLLVRANALPTARKSVSASGGRPGRPPQSPWARGATLRGCRGSARIPEPWIPRWIRNTPPTPVPYPMRDDLRAPSPPPAHLPGRLYMYLVCWVPASLDARLAPRPNAGRCSRSTPLLVPYPPLDVRRRRSRPDLCRRLLPLEPSATYCSVAPYRSVNLSSHTYQSESQSTLANSDIARRARARICARNLRIRPAVLSVPRGITFGARCALSTSPFGRCVRVDGRRV